MIGRRTSTSRKTHAWLEWSTESGTYVLDPTINWAACRADQVGRHNYLPLYAYAGTRKYRASIQASREELTERSAPANTCDFHGSGH